MMEYSNNIGEKIRSIRDSFKLSQDRFGRKIGLSGKTISAYETGKINPPYKIIEKITKTYNVPIFEIPDTYENNLFEMIRNMETTLQDIKNVLNVSSGEVTLEKEY